MEKEEFINPIDIDKVALEPHLLPYSHSVGGVVIKPIDKVKKPNFFKRAIYKYPKDKKLLI